MCIIKVQTGEKHDFTAFRPLYYHNNGFLPTLFIVINTILTDKDEILLNGHSGAVKVVV